jgi:hypothetical protein
LQFSVSSTNAQHPSFFDPGCPLCTVNVQPQPDPRTRLYPRTLVQASRTIPIPADKVALNLEAQAVLAKLGSVWQYYQLIDTQWPTVPPIWTTPLNIGSPARPGITTQIMATESGMGCHSSAGIVTAYDPQTRSKKTAGQLSADFSWLLSQKAQ